MKTFFFGTVLAICLSNCTSKNEVPAVDLYGEITAAEPGFDSTMAANLGADNYGMRSYVLAYLKSGPNRDQDSVAAAALQKAHLENIGRMAESGKLVLAGPFLDDGEIRGIYIFNVATVAEAQALTETDPAIKAGRLVMELHPWYGTAAMPLLNPLHKRLGKQGITD
jgi:uncharacterized protein YciI